MSQHDYTIANQGFPATRADINNALSAIATNNSGTSAPSTQYAGQFWIDTTSSTWTLYIHDGADDIQFATIDTSANTVNFIDSELGDNSVTTAKIADANVTSAKLVYPLTTFSSTGIDDNATSTAITIDSSENVGIGITPTTRFTIGNPSDSNQIMRFSFSDSSTAQIDTTRLAAGNLQSFALGGQDNIKFLTNASERMRITSSGNVGIGITNPNANLNIVQASNTQKLLRLRNNTADTSNGDGFTVEISDSSSPVCTLNMVSGGSDASLAFGTNNVERMRISASGAVSIYGSLSKGSGSFKIDHPLPSKNSTHHLVHSFVESPQADNIYRGKVNLVSGTATVNIDTVAGMSEGTFVLLNRDIQCFTSNETGWTAVKGSVSGNTLTITSQDNTCDDTISWMVVGERQDQHMFDTEWTDENGKVIVEPLKETEQQP